MQRVILDDVARAAPVVMEYSHSNRHDTIADIYAHNVQRSRVPGNSKTPPHYQDYVQNAIAETRTCVETVDD